jgi:hypothetical protein
MYSRGGLLDLSRHFVECDVVVWWCGGVVKERKCAMVDVRMTERREE